MKLLLKRDFVEVEWFLVDTRFVKVLFCDDSVSRKRAFVSNMIGTVFDWEETPSRAIKRLEENAFDVNAYDAIFLDHDYGESSSCRVKANGEVDECGQDITRWIADHADQFAKTFFFIHSSNVDGRALMLRELTQAGLRARVWPWAWDNVTPELVQQVLDEQKETL